MVLAGIAACGGPPPAPAPSPGTTGSGAPPRSADELFLLENSGGQPGDTTVTTPAGIPRMVILRHAFPEQSVFAAVRFDSAAFQAPFGADVTISLVALPGHYGIDLRTSAPFSSATLTFYYAVHFLMPTDARAKYGSAIGFEKAVAIGRQDGTVVQFLSTSRPATDLLETTIRSSGRFVVAAPK